MKEKAVEVIREILRKRDQYDAEKRPRELLGRIVSEGIRSYNLMSEEYNWLIPWELYEEIKKENDKSTESS